MIGLENVTIERDPGGSFILGRYVRGGPTVIPGVGMSVQANRGDSKDQTPGGNRRGSSYRGYTRTFVQTVSEGVDPPFGADVVVRDSGRRYEVHGVECWRPEHPLPHFVADLLEEESITSDGAAVAEELNQSIRDWVIAATGLADDRVLLGRPDGPVPPTTPWVSIIVTSDEKVGFDGVRATTKVVEEVAYEVLGQRLAITEITAYGNPGDNVLGVLEEIRVGQVETVLMNLGHDLDDVADRIGIACVAVGDPLDVAALLDSRYEERVQVIATFGHDERRVLVGDAAGGTIDSVDVTGDVEGNEIKIEETQP